MRSADASARASGAPDLRAALRSATADLHTRVDRAMPLSRPEPALPDYLDHLLLLRDWLDALDAGWPGAPWLAAERRAVLADAERAASLIGRPVMHNAPPPARLLARLRALASGPDAAAAELGLRYVVEGAHLGGRVLRQRLAERLAPHPLDYLGSGSGRWPAFLRELAAQDGSRCRAACNAAVLAFELLLAVADEAERAP